MFRFQWNCTRKYILVSDHDEHQNIFLLLKAGRYDGTCDGFHSEIVRYCQAINKPYLKKKIDSKNGIIHLYIYTCKDIMYHVSIPGESQKTAVRQCCWEWNTIFAKSGPYVWTHIWKLKIPYSILFFPWHTHWLCKSFLWKAKAVVLQNISRRWLVSKLELIWKPLRPMLAARTSDQMELFNSLGRTSL